MSNTYTPSGQVQGIVSEGHASKKHPIPVLKPNPAYLTVTRKIDISNLPSGSMHDSITDGTFTVWFSTPLQKRGPVPSGWATWSSPPYSESSSPNILVSSGTTLTMTLSDPVSTFGFELEPNQFETFAYTADFFFGDTLVESITRDINGEAGARLLALRGALIDRVVVSGPDQFALANLRLQEVVQAQNRTIMMLGALLTLLVIPPLLVW